MSLKTDVALITCHRCNKPIVSSTKGSLTAWMFRSQECCCEFSTSQPPPQTTLVEADELIGSVIADRYEILERIGIGGMGSVYSALDRTNSTKYAIKILSPHLAHREVLAKRMKNEATAVQSLDHGNIVSIYDFVKDSKSPPFLLMDLVDGPNLEQLIRKDQRIPEKRAVELFIQIAEALTHGHEHSVVHRDLKPSNILIASTPSGQEIVKVTDFGIATLSGQDDVEKTKLTQTGELIGTPLYMSPEQCNGAPADARSDIYSFGCVMYEVLTGKPPFAGANPVKVILQHLTADAPIIAPELCSPSLRTVIKRCLEKSADDRYQNCSDLLRDLENIKDGKPISKWSRKTKDDAKKNLAIITSTIFIGAVAIAFYVTQLQPKPAFTTPPPLQTESQTATAGLPFDWDSADFRGQELLNQGNYLAAEKLLQRSLDLAGNNLQRKTISLQKLALLAHMMADTKSEQVLDEKLKNLSTQKEKSANSITPLLKALNLVSPNPSPEQRASIESLAEEILLSVKTLNNNGERKKALEIIDASLPPLERALGTNATIVIEFKSEKVEAIFRDNPSRAGELAQELNKQFVNPPVNRENVYNLLLVRIAKNYNSGYQHDLAEKISRGALHNLIFANSTEAQSIAAKAHLELGLSLWKKFQHSEAGGKNYLQNNPKIDSATVNEAEKELKTGLELRNKLAEDSSAQEYILALAEILLMKYDLKTAEDFLMNAAKSEEISSPLLRAQYLMSVGRFVQSGRQPPITVVYPRKAPSLREALLLRQHALPPEHLLVYESLKELAWLDAVWYFQNQPRNPAQAELESLLRQMIALLERAKQNNWTNDRDVLRDLPGYQLELAYHYYRMNDFEKARKYWDIAYPNFEALVKKGESPYPQVTIPEIKRMAQALFKDDRGRKLLEMLYPGSSI